MSSVSTAFEVHYNQQAAQLSKRDRAAWCVIALAKCGTLEL